MLAVNEEMELIKDDVKIVWANIGEGINGDYNESDPEDINLLRFDVYVKEEEEYMGDNWFPVENGSFCTCIPSNTDKDELTRLLHLFMDRFYPALHDNHEASIKRLAEKMTWITENITENEMEMLCCL